MRTLKFIVEDQLIRQDPGCDFSGLVPGTKGYLQAEFRFSPEWAGCAKIASFYSALGREISYQVLKDGRTCMIPAEALAKQTFKIKVLGTNGDIVLTTDKVAVNQNGGKV